MKLSQKYPKSSRALRNLYRALRGSPFDTFKLADERKFTRRLIVDAMKFGNELQDARAAERALRYAAKILRDGEYSFAASDTGDLTRKIERAMRVTKAALALLKSRAA